MKLKRKVFMALLLAFILAVTPTTLFASAWENEAGRAFKAQLTELFGDMHAEWVVEDLELLRSNDVLCDEVFYAMLEMGVNAALEYHLTQRQLEEFLTMTSQSARFWFLYDALLSLHHWVEWDDWGWDDWDDWDWSPSLSDIWKHEGLALLTQLTELVGEMYAMWFAQDWDWMWGMFDEDVYAEMLTLDLMDFLAEHLSAEELEQFLSWDYDTRYWILWDLLIYAFPLDWGNWDSGWTPTLSPIWEDEGLALKEQLIEIISEDRARRVAEDLDWYLSIGRMSEEIFAEILAMDVMAALEAHFTAEELEYFFSLSYSSRHWDLWDFIIQPMIWAPWLEMVGDTTIEDVIAALEYLKHEYLEYFDFDLAALLVAADMTMEDLADLMYAMLTLMLDDMMWFMMWDEYWLHEFIDDMLWSLRRLSEAEAVIELQMMASVVVLLEVLGDNVFEFFFLRIFDDVIGLFGNSTFEQAFFLNPNLEYVLLTYQDNLIALVDFRLRDALSELFATDGQWPEGLRVLDALLGGLLSDNLDELYAFYTDVPPPPRIDFWRFVSDWEYLALEPQNLEERKSFDITVGTEIAIDFLNMEDAHLNLFFDNHGEDYIHFVIEFSGSAGFEERLLVVAPGGDATVQLTADELVGGGSLVWVMVVNTEGDISGEFALRKTHHPPYFWQ